MAAGDYALLFAGVPFFSDDSRTYRFSRPGGSEEEGRSAVRKHQSEGWLYDEVERLLPADYLQDMAPVRSYPGRNTGQLARQERRHDTPGPRVRLGDFYYPTTACRWAYFRGLASSSQAKAMLAATGGNRSAEFVFYADPDTRGTSGRSYRVSTQLFMLPPKPLGEAAGTFDGLYLVTLVDERFFWQNVPVSLRPDYSLTWQQCISQIASLLNVSITYSAIPPAYGVPEPDSQLWTNDEDAGVLLDAVAFNVGRTLVRNYDGTYKLYNAYESLEIARNNRRDSQGQVIRRMGGDCFVSGTSMPVGSLQKARNVLPKTVRVHFPKFVNTETAPHFAQFRQRWSRFIDDSYEGTYAIDVPLLSGGSSGAMNLFSGLAGSPLYDAVGSGWGVHSVADTAKALYPSDSLANSGTPTNLTELQDLAVQIASDYYQQTGIDGLDEVYDGSLAWTPEGLHDLLFSWSARWRKACLRVMRAEFDAVVREMQHCPPSCSGIDVPPGSFLSSGQTVIIEGDQFTNVYIYFTDINIIGSDTFVTNLLVQNVTINLLDVDIFLLGDLVLSGDFCLIINVPCIKLKRITTTHLEQDNFIHLYPARTLKVIPGLPAGDTTQDPSIRPFFRLEELGNEFQPNRMRAITDGGTGGVGGGNPNGKTRMRLTISQSQLLEDPFFSISTDPDGENDDLDPNFIDVYRGPHRLEVTGAGVGALPPECPLLFTFCKDTTYVQPFFKMSWKSRPTFSDSLITIDQFANDADFIVSENAYRPPTWFNSPLRVNHLFDLQGAYRQRARGAAAFTSEDLSDSNGLILAYTGFPLAYVGRAAIPDFRVHGMQEPFGIVNPNPPGSEAIRITLTNEDKNNSVYLVHDSPNPGDSVQFWVPAELWTVIPGPGESYVGYQIFPTCSVDVWYWPNPDSDGTSNPRWLVMDNPPPDAVNPPGVCEVKVTATDEDCGYLYPKTTSPDGSILLTVVNPAGSQALGIDTVGYTGTKDVVVSVVCDGGSLTVDTVTWTFLNGLLQDDV